MALAHEDAGVCQGLGATWTLSLSVCIPLLLPTGPHFQAAGSAPSALPTPYMKMWCGAGGRMPRMKVMCGPRFIAWNREPENGTSCRWSWFSVDGFPPVTHLLIQVRMV